LIILAFLIGLAIHFIPTIIAVGKEHPSKGAIFAVNLFLGWTLLGWVGALIWALSSPAKVQRVVEEDIFINDYQNRAYSQSPSDFYSVSDEIKKLGDLKNDGLLTDAEFRNKKQQLLNLDDDIDIEFH